MTASSSAKTQWNVLAGAALSVLAVTYLSVLYRAVDIDGDLQLFFVLVGGAAGAGLLAGRTISLPGALISGAIITGGGSLLYLSSIPPGYSISLTIDGIWADTVALLTGMSILRIINAGMWAAAVAPVPTFLLAYFAARRQFGYSAFVGCTAVVFVVLTGDISGTNALVGVLATVFTLGIADLDRRGAGVLAADRVLVVMTVILVCTVSISIVPGGSAPLSASSGSNSGETIEASLTQSSDQLTIGGSISLDPTVRFTVESQRRAYWRVGAFDRYTGDGWVRTADTGELSEELSAPPSAGREFTQRVSPRDSLSVMPAAWRPVAVNGQSAIATGFGSVQPRERLLPGDNYTVTSRAVSPTPPVLRNATEHAPEDLHDRYTQLPESTPARLTRYTDQLTENAENSYDTARIVSNHLQENWNYSLSVPDPDGQIASTFLFEREAGYCTYFATTMVTMLRSQDVPARMVVGYAPGQEVSNGEWVVRGLDAHAWVEVYFTDVGWVRFDPTPASPRRAAEQAALEAAREDDAQDVDTTRSDPTTTATPTPTPTPDSDGSTAERTPTDRTPTPSAATPSANGSGPGYQPDEFAADSTGESGAEPFTLELPPPRTVLFGLVGLGGVLSVIRRRGLFERLERTVWLYRLSRSDPVSDVTGVYERLEYLLARSHRPRAPGETRHEYVTAVGTAEDRRLVEIYEQVVYAGEHSESLAAEAIELFERRRDSLTRPSFGVRSHIPPTEQG